MTEPDRPRRPRSVYDAGDEPDPRFSLANERTFLAWVRTTLAVLLAAAALSVVDLPVPRVVQDLASAAVALCGVATAWQAWVGWARTERALRLGRPLPANGTSAPLAVMLVVLAVALAVALVARAVG